jgi:hypothetical protein
MSRNCHVFAHSRWAILPPLLLADGGYLDISQLLSYTLLAVHSGCPITLKSFFQRLLAKTWQFLSLFSEVPLFCKHLLKVK